MWVHPKKKNYARKWKEGELRESPPVLIFLMRVFLYGVRRGLLRFFTFALCSGGVIFFDCSFFLYSSVYIA
jgi:hypothetical protein